MEESTSYAKSIALETVLSGALRNVENAVSFAIDIG